MSSTHMATRSQAHRVEAAKLLGDHAFRANAVGGGHEHRPAVPIGGQLEEAGEATDTGEDLGAMGGRRASGPISAIALSAASRSTPADS